MNEATIAIDEDRLAMFLASELGVEVTDIDLLNDGLNLSLAISIDDGGRAFVLRRPNKLRDTEPFNDLAQEYAVLARLQDTPVLAPTPVMHCQDAAVIGDPFLLLSYLDGEVISLGESLPSRFSHPAARERLADELVETLAELHAVDVESFDSTCDRVPLHTQLARTVDRLDTIDRAIDHECSELWDVARWLRANVPPDPEFALLHGDFRPGNILFSGERVPEITGVIDWETALLGDPFTEVGYLLLRWRDEGDPRISLGDISDRYPESPALRKVEAMNERGLAPFTAEPGSPNRETLITRYEAMTGRTFTNHRFYMAFAAFMLATVWVDLHRHQIERGMRSDWGPSIDFMTRLADAITAGVFEC